MTEPKDTPALGEYLIRLERGKYALNVWHKEGHAVYEGPQGWFPVPLRYEPGWLCLGSYGTFEAAEEAMGFHAKPRRYDASGNRL